MLRKIFSLILATCLIIGMLGTVPVFASPTSGSCGTGVTWEVSEDKTTLIISGEGAIRDYWYDGYPGWYYYAQESITKIIIENGVTGIGDYAFYDMCSIETVVIPSTLTEIGDYVFDNCEKLTTIHFGGNEEAWTELLDGYELPESATIHYAGDEEYTPADCFEFSNGVITGYTGSYSEVVIPSVIDGVTVTTIGNNAFQNNGNITSVVIPDTVISINSFAFDNCYMLENIELPDSITTIESYAFRWTAVKSIELPSKLTRISQNMLNQTQLEYIKIPSEVKIIDQFAFYACGSLKYVIIPATVTDINYSAFHWSGVTDVYYEGTSTQWSSVFISNYNDPVRNAAKHYNYTKPTGISMKETTAEMWVGDRVQLEVEFIPSTAIFTLCKWTSSNETVATVDENGTVTAHSQGDAVITATSVDGGYSANCAITTKNVPFTSFNIKDDSMELVINEEKRIEYEYTPENATTDAIIWTSSDTSVAEMLEENTIIGTGKGTATITGTTSNGQFADTITVTVVDNYGSGTLDNGMTWIIDHDRTLTVSGEGDMPDYQINEQDADGTSAGIDKEDKDLGNPAPWYEFAENIEAICVDNGITSIGDYTFYNLFNVCDIQLPDTLKEIGKKAFSNIWKQFEMDIPDSVETIDDYAFAHNNAAFTTGLPTGLKTIGNYAFYYHNMSTSPMPIIPESVTAIGKCAFLGSSLTEIYIPANVETIGEGAFANCDSLNVIEIDDNNKNFVVEKNTLYNANKTTLMLCVDRTSTYFDVPSTVTRIDAYAFCRMYNFTGINLTNSVKTIGEAAFQQCNISYVYLPEGLTSIDNSAFSNCGQLSQITIPKSVETIGQSAFGYCYQLSQITLNDGLKTIGDYAFDGCMHSYINIPASVTTIGKSAFRSNTLMNITVDNSNQSFTVIDNVLYTKDNKILKQYPTARSTETLIVPSGTEKIENDAFNQAQVNRVILPETVTEIGNMAFSNSILQFINLPDSITKIGYNAFSSTQLTDVGLPNNLEIIPSGLLNNCWSLVNVTIGTGTKKIEGSAFSYTSLCNLYINGVITEIPYHTFEGSNNLSRILFAGTKEDWDNIKIEGMNTPLENTNVYYENKSVRGISVDKSEITMSIGDTNVISATINCDEEELLLPWWTVTGDAVTVDDNGNIKAVNAGTSAVIAHAPGGYSDVCIVYVEESGKCGKNVTWKFDGNSTLIISGTGDMDNYDLHGSNDGDETATIAERPWIQYGPQIKTVKIERGVTSIGDFAFAAFPQLRAIEIPDTITTIGDYAFEGSSITKIHLPAGVTTLKADALSMCDELESITTDSNNANFTAIDGILYDKAVKTLIKLPESMKIAIYEVPSTVTEIAPYAAERVSIKALIIPEGVKSIGEGAFAKTNSMMNIMLPASLEAIGEDAFYGAPIRVIVYGGSKEQFNVLVPATDETTTTVNPLQNAIYKIYNSHDKVHSLILDCFDSEAEGMVVCAEIAAFRPFTAVAAVYDSTGVMLEAKIIDVEASSDFAECDFKGRMFNNGIKVRMFMLDSITTMRPVGASIEKVAESNSATGGGGDTVMVSN